MDKNRTVLNPTPLALLTLAACGGGSDSSTPSFSASSGKVEDGPLQNAIAFLDYNDNGILDAGEPSERTGVDGSYSLTPTQANYSIVAVTDETTFDTISQSFVPGITLKAPSNSSMVTPTTTLMEDGGLTAGEVMAVLGLPEDMDPFTYSAHADISALTGTAKTDAEELALQVELANQQILSVVNSFAATAQGSGVSEAAAFSAALMSVAEVIKTEANKATVVTLDLSDATALGAIETKIVSKVNVLAASDATIKNNEFAATMAETVKAAVVVNTKIQTITDTDLTSSATKDILSISQVLKNQVHEAAVATVTNNAGNAAGTAVTTATVAFASTDTTAFENAISNKAPTGMALSSSSISEDSLSLEIGTLGTTDTDQSTGVAFTYAIAEVAGSDYASFTIDQATGKLSFASSVNPDHETKSSYSLTILTTDSGGKTFSKSFDIAVTNINEAPTVKTAITDQTVAADSTLNFQIDTNIFADVDVDDTLTYVATLSTGAALPTWLNFNATTQKFSGTPVNSNIGTIAVKVTATDAGNLAISDTFNITVTETVNQFAHLYTSGALLADATNGAWFDQSLEVYGIDIVTAGEVGGQTAVPDEWALKIAQTIKLLVDPNESGTNQTAQAQMISTLDGATGTWHEGSETAQRVAKGNSDAYSPNPLQDPTSYSGYEAWIDSHSEVDMIWYGVNDGGRTGDGDITEVLEHLMHTIHQFGVRGGVDGSFTALMSNSTDESGNSSSYKSNDLYLAMKQAMDNGIFTPDYGAGNDGLLMQEYTYLLNFNMWEFGKEFWDKDSNGVGSLTGEWSDNARTPEDIQTNNSLGYELFNTYFEPVLSKPDVAALRDIFQDNDAGLSGYTPDII